MGKNPYRRADRFTKKAKAEGYAARSVFKLSAVVDRNRFIRQGMRVVDLGCFPGSWSKFALQRVGPKGAVVGIDIKPPKISGGVFYQKDVYEVTPEELAGHLGGPADVILSDMAPNTTGIPLTDHVRQIELVRRALAIAEMILVPGGSLFVKVFDGEEVPDLQHDLRERFEKVKRYRPEAVRRVSREFFLLGTGFKGGEHLKD